MAVSVARLKYIRISARKVRLVAGLVQDKYVNEALGILGKAKKSAALHIRKALNSCIANAKMKGEHNPEAYRVKIKVDEGPSLKRYKAGSMGRAMVIRKRMAHIYVELF